MFTEEIMYLSKVMIHGSISRNPYEIHRALWRLFPEDADAERDYLFRVERSGQQQAEVLMQSCREPVAHELPGIKLMASRDYPLNLSMNQRLRFLLVANPVKTISDENGRLNSKGEVKKCRVPLIHEVEWRAWLERKLAGVVDLETVIAEKRFPLNFRKAKEKRVGKIQPVNFEGILQVKDSSSFVDLVSSGIGPAKAFGCGLLSLVRA
jgi:CRISPR system Cascade subunit CasE